MTVTAKSLKKDAEVIIVGAGPVGLFICLMIAREGINVALCETYNGIIRSPRAVAYGPAAVIELERAGIAQECRDAGMEPSDYEFTLRWITLDNKLIAVLPLRLMEGYPPVLCGQHQVAAIILRHLKDYPNVKVLWCHKVVGLEQDADTVVATCETSEGEVKIAGEYLVGADGARSTVRKLIGCTFDGFTYEKMIVATNVFYPFREHGFADGQFIIHPEHFAMVGKISPDGMYRVSYGEDASLSHDEARANLDNKFNLIFPGPKPIKYDLRMFSPYKLHQRRANTFRVGRVLLAGDAAHTCNPFGGMGLTGGLCDAGGLSDCLIGVLRKGCGDDLLDKYATIRKRIFNEVTDPISQGNIERLFKLNPETAASEHELFRMMNENDDVKREILKGAMALQHGIPGVVRKRLILDFRQYYPENVAAQKAAANNAQTA